VATAAELLQLAKTHHVAGRLAEAEPFYRAALAADGSSAEAHFLLGVVCHLLGRPDEAIALLARAVAGRPNHVESRHYLAVVLASRDRLDEAVAHLQEAQRQDPHSSEILANLRNVSAARCDAQGQQLAGAGRWEEAAVCHQEALGLQADYVPALGNLGNALKNLGRMDDAAACYRRILEIAPNVALAHNDLGLIAQAQGQLPQAVEHYRRALELDDNFAEAHTNLGTAMAIEGRLSEAESCCRRAIWIKPEFADAHHDLGAVLVLQDRLDDALASFDRAIALAPNLAIAYLHRGDVYRSKRMHNAAILNYQECLSRGAPSADAYLNLAISYCEIGQPDLAVECCHQGLKLQPRNALLCNTMAYALLMQGQADAMLEWSRRAIDLAPDNAALHGNLIYALNYIPGIDPASLFAEHLAWGKRHADPLTVLAPPHDNNRTLDRRLRIGYVSAHFCRHAVHYFSEPLLAAHDHEQFEIYCYSDSPSEDDATARILPSADHWRRTSQATDEQLAQMIRDDRIDILVDLAGHISGNRLLVFARKPAPIQVTYIGYQNTTGMSAMDYRLTDERADPPGRSDALHTEKLVRLPRSFFCYRPPAEAPPITPLPARATGQVTFGSFNSFGKVTPQVIAVWLTILERVNSSRLMVLADRGGFVERRLGELAQERGLDPARIVVVDRRPLKEYLQLLQLADIALDAFPFNGHTTTCDSIWMGVPVVMLEGETYASRFGGSVLANVGLASAIAGNVEQYVEVAVGLAEDLDALESLRSELRPRMASSVLLDFAGFARNVEAAYRQMWHVWCATAKHD
jgi:predicted O-linked N-acetylglucosamine transferase (SPINDLY family)